jgi:hypothetical protein
MSSSTKVRNVAEWRATAARVLCELGRPRADAHSHPPDRGSDRRDSCRRRGALSRIRAG